MEFFFSMDGAGQNFERTIPTKCSFAKEDYLADF